MSIQVCSVGYLVYRVALQSDYCGIMLLDSIKIFMQMKTSDIRKVCSHVLSFLCIFPENHLQKM